jgi:hypothetical protein
MLKKIQDVKKVYPDKALMRMQMQVISKRQRRGN